MELGLEVTVTKNEFRNIADKTRGLLYAVLRKSAFDLEARIKTAAPVDTGALRASIFVETKRLSTYGQAVAEAASKNPDAKFIGQVRPSEELEAIVAVGVLYGVYVNFGTIRMPATLFFSRAVETVRPNFERAVRAAMVKGAA